MSTILAFAGSNSSTSINHQLIAYTASLVKDHDVQVLKMSEHPFPIYSEDLEKQEGFSNELKAFNNNIKTKDALIISVNEHNSGLSAYTKNLIDWFSRLDRNFLEGKKVFLMSTSPGKRGAISALNYAVDTLPRFGAMIIDTFSLPSFYDNFKEGRIGNDELDTTLKAKLAKFLKEI